MLPYIAYMDPSWVYVYVEPLPDAYCVIEHAETQDMWWSLVWIMVCESWRPDALKHLFILKWPQVVSMKNQ